MVRGVALEAVEGFPGLFVEHGFGAALLHESGFDESAAAESPGGVEGEFELDHLDAVGGGELIEESVVHGGEGGFLAGHDEVLLGG